MQNRHDIRFLQLILNHSLNPRTTDPNLTATSILNLNHNPHLAQHPHRPLHLPPRPRPRLLISNPHQPLWRKRRYTFYGSRKGRVRLPVIRREGGCGDVEQAGVVVAEIPGQGELAEDFGGVLGFLGGVGGGGGGGAGDYADFEVEGI